MVILKLTRVLNGNFIPKRSKHVSCYKLLEAKGVERSQKGVKMKEKCKGCNKYDEKEDKCKRIGKNGKIGVCWFEEEY